MNSQTYRITSVEDTDLDPDQYGNKFYKVTLEGHNGPLLWKTAKRPEVGLPVYGHTELSKSGKSMLFKKDKKPDDYREPSPRMDKPTHISESMPQVTPPSNKDKDIQWAVCIKMANEYLTKNRPNLSAELWASEVLEYAQCMNANYNQKTVAPKPQDTTPSDDEVDNFTPEQLADIPF